MFSGRLLLPMTGNRGTQWVREEASALYDSIGNTSDTSNSKIRRKNGNVKRRQEKQQLRKRQMINRKDN